MEGMTYRLLFNKNQSQINYKKMKQNLIQADNDINMTAIGQTITNPYHFHVPNVSVSV